MASSTTPHHRPIPVVGTNTMQTRDIPAKDFMTAGELADELHKLIETGKVSKDHTVPVLKGGVMFMGLGTWGGTDTTDIYFLS